VLHEVLEQGEFAASVVITFQVMAFAGMSPGDPDAVGSLPQRGQEEVGAHPSGAGDADDPDVGRVLHAADAGKVGGAVAAPVAKECEDSRFPISHLCLLKISLCAATLFQLSTIEARNPKFEFNL
jgi:hypothetical protein